MSFLAETHLFFFLIYGGWTLCVLSFLDGHAWLASLHGTLESDGKSQHWKIHRKGKTNQNIKNPKLPTSVSVGFVNNSANTLRGAHYALFSSRSSHPMLLFFFLESHYFLLVVVYSWHLLSVSHVEFPPLALLLFIFPRRTYSNMDTLISVFLEVSCDCMYAIQSTACTIVS